MLGCLVREGNKRDGWMGIIGREEEGHTLNRIRRRRGPLAWMEAEEAE